LPTEDSSIDALPTEAGVVGGLSMATVTVVAARGAIGGAGAGDVFPTTATAHQS
jgi:hypothetical protein